MERSRPNILWICTDQQRYDTIRALGNEHIRTPNLDRLVEQGVAFTQAYTQSPICTPSRACFLTGCYPSTLHVNRNGNAYFPAPDRLITRRLAHLGYDGGLAGKLHLSAAHNRVEKRPPDDGYRVFKWSHHPYPETFWPTHAHAYQAWLEREGVVWEEAYGGAYDWRAANSFDTDQDRYQIACGGIEARYHQTTWCANEAIDFMSELRRGPWFMSVNPFAPHPPLDPPPEYMARMDVDDMPMPLFQPHEMTSQLAFSGVDHQTPRPVDPHAYDARRMVAAYYAQIELIDEQVGRMVAALEATGQRENTIIIFMSDHGEMLGDHGLRLKGCRFYEGAVHVPLIISWPGHIRSGLRSEALVELTDLAPTLYDALALNVPDYVQGHSLWPILSGAADRDHHRDIVRCEYHDAVKLREGSHANMVFDGRFKLVVYHNQPLGELYDLQQDPHEFRNLWESPEYQKVRFDLLKRCFDMLMQATDVGQPRVANY